MIDDEGWEARMSARAAQRRVWAAEREGLRRLMILSAVRDVQPGAAWLHGWGINGTQVWISSGVHCGGCGLLLGVATVAYDDDWEPGTAEPDWPFTPDECRVHWREDKS